MASIASSSALPSQPLHSAPIASSSAAAPSDESSSNAVSLPSTSNHHHEEEEEHTLTGWARALQVSPQLYPTSYSSAAHHSDAGINFGLDLSDPSSSTFRSVVGLGDSPLLGPTASTSTGHRLSVGNGLSPELHPVRSINGPSTSSSSNNFESFASSFNYEGAPSDLLFNHHHAPSSLGLRKSSASQTSALSSTSVRNGTGNTSVEAQIASILGTSSIPGQPGEMIAHSSVRPEDDPRIKAYAKLEFATFDIYIQKLSVIVGRRPAAATAAALTATATVPALEENGTGERAVKLEDFVMEVEEVAEGHGKEEVAESKEGSISEVNGKAKMNIPTVEITPSSPAATGVESTSRPDSGVGSPISPAEPAESIDPEQPATENENEKDGLTIVKQESLNEISNLPAPGFLTDIDLGPIRAVSRQHARIFFCYEMGSWAIEVLGRNGVVIDGQWKGKGEKTALSHRTKIQIAERIFHFVLPPSDATVAAAAAAEEKKALFGEASMIAGGELAEDDEDHDDDDGNSSSSLSDVSESDIELSPLLDTNADLAGGAVPSSSRLRLKLNLAANSGKASSSGKMKSAMTPLTMAPPPRKAAQGHTYSSPAPNKKASYSTLPDMSTLPPLPPLPTMNGTAGKGKIRRPGMGKGKGKGKHYPMGKTNLSYSRSNDYSGSESASARGDYDDEDEDEDDDEDDEESDQDGERTAVAGDSSEDEAHTMYSHYGKQPGKMPRNQPDPEERIDFGLDDESGNTFISHVPLMQFAEVQPQVALMFGAPRPPSPPQEDMPSPSPSPSPPPAALVSDPSPLFAALPDLPDLPPLPLPSEPTPTPPVEAAHPPPLPTSTTLPAAPSGSASVGKKPLGRPPKPGSAADQRRKSNANSVPPASSMSPAPAPTSLPATSKLPPLPSPSSSSVHAMDPLLASPSEAPSPSLSSAPALTSAAILALPIISARPPSGPAATLWDDPSIPTSKLPHSAAPIHKAPIGHPIFVPAPMPEGEAPREAPPHDRNMRPPYTYGSLIAQAVATTEHNKMTMSQVYDWIDRRWPFFRANQPGWQNSVRHNLTPARGFIKIERRPDEPGKSNFWTVDPAQVSSFDGLHYRKKAASAMHRPTTSHSNSNGSISKAGSPGMPGPSGTSANGNMPITTTQNSNSMTTMTPTPPTAHDNAYTKPPPPTTSSAAGAPLSAPLPIIVGPIPDSYVRPTPPPSSAPPDEITAALLRDPPIVLHEGKLIINPGIFAHLTQEQLANLETLPASNALQILQAYVVQHFKEKMKRLADEKAARIRAEKAAQEAAAASQAAVLMTSTPAPSLNNGTSASASVSAPQTRSSPSRRSVSPSKETPSPLPPAAKSESAPIKKSAAASAKSSQAASSKRKASEDPTSANNASTKAAKLVSGPSTKSSRR